MLSPMISLFTRVAYGVDWQAGLGVVVRAVRRGGRTSWAARAAGGADALKPVLADLAREADTLRAVSSAALTARDSLIRRIDIPVASRVRARRILPSLLDIRLPFPVEAGAAAVTDWHPSGGGWQALTAAAPGDALRRRLEELRAAGVDPQIVESEGVALWGQSLAECPSAANEARVVAAVAADQAVLAYGRGAFLEGAQVVRAEPSWPAALAARARHLAQALTSGQPAPSLLWIWTGPEAVRAAAGLTERELPGARFAVVSDPDTFLARALACRALDPRRAAAQLRIGAFESAAGLRRRLRAARRWTLAAAAAGLVLSAGAGAWHGWLVMRERAAQTALTKLALDLSGWPSVQKGQEVADVRAAREEQRASAAAFRAIRDAAVSADLADLTRAANGQGVRFYTLTLQPDRGEARGAAKNAAAAAAWKTWAEARGWNVDLAPAGAEGGVPIRMNRGAGV